ncbi:UNVERIFIED_CONTAM: hypothetical protein Sradi_5389900 [Sesamum radiatum]|uniref:Uncharacterized protein n=1 Tax=Sesamum radiatum TaxID=300843 RepID=A0AAW2LQ30_SESRA
MFRGGKVFKKRQDRGRTAGGTGFNGVVEELKKLTTRVSHVLPVSDDGGSTAEIVRVLGGPAVGDIRSRCLRLSDQSTTEALAVRTLLGHRLPLDAQKAKFEWYDIVEGNHSLWNGVSKPYRETIRAFLVYFQDQDGTIIRGQNEISHPTNGSMEPINKVLLGIGEIVSSRSCSKVTVDSLQDSTAGILFDPKSLIQSLANLLRGNA